MKFFCFLCLSMVISLSGWAQQTKLQVTTNGGFENRINSYIGNTFTRDIEIFNVQSGSFTGYIKIKENSGSSLKGSMKIKASVPGSVALVDVIPSNPEASKIITPAGNPVGLEMIAAQDNEIVLRVVNFKQNLEKVLLHQDLSVTACLNANNTSTLSISFVETSSMTVPQLSEYISIDGAGALSQAVYAGATPVHKVFDYEDSHEFRSWYESFNVVFKREDFHCTSNTNHKTMRVSVGLSDLEKFSGATLHNFKLEVIGYNSDNGQRMLFTIDRTSIVIEKRSNTDNALLSSWAVSDQKNIQYGTTTNDPTDASCLSTDQKFEKLTYELGDLGPNEHYNIQYDLYNCCKKADLFDGKVTQSTVYLWYTFEDDCGGFQGLNGTRLLGPNQGYTAGLNMKSTINSSPSHLAGESVVKSFNDIGNFVIDNDIVLQDYSAMANGQGFVYNELTAELVVRLKAGPKLRYIANTPTDVVGSIYYDFATNPGGFSYYPALALADKYVDGKIWNPINPSGTIIPGSPAGYEMREFRFKISEMPDLSDPTNRQEIFDKLPANIKSMQLVFSMVGICPVEGDGNWEVQFLFDTDHSCSACLQPISKVLDVVDVVCPGCRVPGAAVSAGSAERSFYGPYDANNDGIPDAGETEASVHTLAEVSLRNNNGIASDDIQTALASVNDDITFSSHFYLTQPSDCEAPGGRVSCRDNELQYQWAYLQVRVPKGYLDPSMSNVQVEFRRVGASTYVPIANTDVFQLFYEGATGQQDVFYLKVNVAATGYAYFLSYDAFNLSFRSRVIKNVVQRERQAITYVGYFTKAEEILSVTNPVFGNRSYADCSTAETRGIHPTCDTENLQMICEGWGSYLTFVGINTAFFRYQGSGFTPDKTCEKYVKANSLGSYAGEKSNFGNPDGVGGLNLYKNEFRKAPQIEFIDIAIPAGYYFHQIEIGTSINNNNFVEEKFFIKTADLSGLNETKNGLIGTDRLLHFDLRNFYSIADGNYNAAKPIHYSDESFQPMAFHVSLVADCKYLSTHGIVETDLGSIPDGNGGKIYSTALVDNPFVGNQGLFIISGDNQITQSPLYNANTAKFILNKFGAEDNEFKIQKKTTFVNELDFIQTLTPNLYKDDFSGYVFFGVNATELSKYFSDFKVENIVNGTPVEIININPVLGINKSFGSIHVHYDAPKRLRISGNLNMNLITDCSAEKKAIYELFYGINCDQEGINAQSVIDGSLCNTWKERIELRIDGVDMLLTTNEASYPVVAGNLTSHQAIFTATRSQINQLDIKLTHSGTVETAIQKLRLIKNTGTSISYLDLVVGDNFSISPDNTHIIIHTLPGDAIFESLTDGENYYNQVELIFDVKNIGCVSQNVQTQIIGTATPFYSSTLCKVVAQSTVQSSLIAEIATVQIVGNDLLCSGGYLHLEAQVTGSISSSATFTWYKVYTNDNGSIIRTLIQGPDANNIYYYANLMEATTYEVVLTDGSCSSTDDIVINLHPRVNLTIIAPNEFCIGSAPARVKGLPEGGYFSGPGISFTAPDIYTFSASVAGVYEITYFYIDPVTNCFYSKIHTIVVSACCKYALVPIDVTCGEDAIRCITLTAVKPVDDGIKGMDFTLRYDRTLMRPTGIPGRGNATLGPVVLNGSMTSGMGSYALTERTVPNTNLNELHVSIFYTGQAPAVADFDGIGDVICIEFKVLGSATGGLYGQTKNITIGDIYGNEFSPGVVDDEHKLFIIRSCVENEGRGLINIKKNNFLQGKILYHNDTNAPLRYDAVTTPIPYLITTIQPVTTGYGSSTCDPTLVAPSTTDINGLYKIDLTGGNGLKLGRDIVGDYYNSCTSTVDVIDQNGNVYKPASPASVLVSINGYDAYLMESITTMRNPSDVVYVADRKVPAATSAGNANTLFPTPFQMIASDVNMDKKVRAVDITLVQERAVSKLCEYPQVWNYNLGSDPDVFPANTTDQRSLDWRFVDKSQVTSNLSYRKSQRYPLGEGTTGTAAAAYWRDNVPSPQRCLMGPIATLNACKSYANNFDIHAIMLGDIDGSWRANINGAQKNLRTETENHVVLRAAQTQQIAPNTYRVPVSFVSHDPATVSVDFALDYNEAELAIRSVGTLEAGNTAVAKVVYNDFEHKELLFTSYSMTGFNSSDALYYIDFVSASGQLNPNMLGSGDAYLNGQKVSLVVEGSTITGIDDLISGSQYGFDLIPNPTADQGEIVYNIKSGSHAKIAVYNTLGQLVTEYTDLEGQGSIQVGTSTWSSGMYQVILFTENSQKLIKKWVIQN